MKICYKKLWHLLIDREMSKGDFRKLTGISSATAAKLAKDENVQTDILMKICTALNVGLNDIVDSIPNGNITNTQKEEANEILS
ncbi:transcriptional regulator [Clostridia bacterium]|nr:transcriptional regulator [Clostridia bacterium]